LSPVPQPLLLPRLLPEPNSVRGTAPRRTPTVRSLASQRLPRAMDRPRRSLEQTRCPLARKRRKQPFLGPLYREFVPVVNPTAFRGSGRGDHWQLGMRGRRYRTVKTQALAETPPSPLTPATITCRPGRSRAAPIQRILSRSASAGMSTEGA